VGDGVDSSEVFEDVCKLFGDIQTLFHNYLIYKMSSDSHEGDGLACSVDVELIHYLLSHSLGGRRGTDEAVQTSCRHTPLSLTAPRSRSPLLSKLKIQTHLILPGKHTECVKPVNNFTHHLVFVGVNCLL